MSDQEMSFENIGDDEVNSEEDDDEGEFITPSKVRKIKFQFFQSILRYFNFNSGA